MIDALEYEKIYRFWGIFLLSLVSLVVHDRWGVRLHFLLDIPFIVVCVSAFFVSGFELLLLCAFSFAFLGIGMYVSGVSALLWGIPIALFFTRKFFMLQPWVIRIIMMTGCVLLFSIGCGYEAGVLTHPYLLLPVLVVNTGVFGALFLLLSWIYGETPVS